MDTFEALREKTVKIVMERTKGRKLRVDTISSNEVKELMRVMYGLYNVCIWCGKKITVEQQRNLNPMYPNRSPYCDSVCQERWIETYTFMGIRSRMIKEKNGICERCGTQQSGSLHHIIPLSEGGEPFKIENLMLLCDRCHRKEHNDLGFCRS